MSRRNTNRSKPKEDLKVNDYLENWGSEEKIKSEPEIEVKSEVEIKDAPERIKLYKVRVDHPSLRKRKAPNTLAEVVGLIEDQGYYYIYDEANGWGQLEDQNWIMLSYTHIVHE